MDCDLRSDLTRERWFFVGTAEDEDIFWSHYPSRRCVSVTEIARKNAHVPTWGHEPVDKKTIGFVVSCQLCDDSGNPINGDAFWTESQAMAVRLARRIREEILAEYPDTTRHAQMSLFTEEQHS